MKKTNNKKKGLPGSLSWKLKIKMIKNVVIFNNLAVTCNNVLILKWTKNESRIDWFFGGKRKGKKQLYQKIKIRKRHDIPDFCSMITIKVTVAKILKSSPFHPNSHSLCSSNHSLLNHLISPLWIFYYLTVN